MKKYRDHDFYFEITSGPSRTDGQHVRYYVIRCHRCDNSSSYHASGISNERMRKLFKRQGWHVGKARNQHVCPECQRKRESYIAEHGEPQEFARAVAREALDLDAPPSKIEQIRALWLQLSPEEHAEFVLWIEKELNVMLVDPLEAWRPETPRSPAPDATLSVADNARYTVVEPGLTPLEYDQTLSAEEYRSAQEKFGADMFTAKLLIEAQPEPTPEPEPDPEPESIAANDDDDEPADWWKEMMAR